MQSDTNFVLFRRFGYLHARLLLHKQDVLIGLEQELNNLDDNDTNAFSLNSRRTDQNTARHNVLTELEPKLIEYGRLRRPPSSRGDRLTYCGPTVGSVFSPIRAITATESEC